MFTISWNSLYWGSLYQGLSVQLTHPQKHGELLNSLSILQFCLYRLKQVYQKDVAQKKTQNIFWNENNHWYQWILTYQMQNVSEHNYEDYNISCLIFSCNIFDVLLTLMIQNVSSKWCFQPVKIQWFYFNTVCWSEIRGPCTHETRFSELGFSEIVLDLMNKLQLPFSYLTLYSDSF